MTAQPHTRAAADIEQRVAFVDAALALAGHEVTDPAQRRIVRDVAAGTISETEAIEQAKALLGITIG